MEIARLGEVHAGLGLAAGLLAIGAAGMLLGARRRDAGGRGVAALPASVVLAGAGFVVIAPGLVVLAKGAYLLAVVPAVVGVMGWLLSRGGWKGAAGNRARAGSWTLAAAGMVALGAAPRIFVPGEGARPVAETVAELEKIWPQDGRAVLLGVSASSYAHYIGDARCLGVEPFSEASGVAGQSASLADLLTHFAPRAVLVTDDWRRSARLDGMEIARLLAAPQWERREVPAGELYWRRSER